MLSWFEHRNQIHVIWRRNRGETANIIVTKFSFQQKIAKLQQKSAFSLMIGNFCHCYTSRKSTTASFKSWYQLACADQAELQLVSCPLETMCRNRLKRIYPFYQAELLGGCGKLLAFTCSMIRESLPRWSRKQKRQSSVPPDFQL